MRSRLGGGIVEFYRMQATGEVAPGRSANLLQSGSIKDCGLQAPSPANKHFPSQDSVLARDILAAVARGSQIQCNIKQYPKVRAALAEAAEISDESENEPNALWARSEIQRLDLLFFIRNEPEGDSRTTVQGHEAADYKPSVIPSSVDEGALSSAPE